MSTIPILIEVTGRRYLNSPYEVHAFAGEAPPPKDGEPLSRSLARAIRFMLDDFDELPLGGIDEIHILFPKDEEEMGAMAEMMEG